MTNNDPQYTKADRARLMKSAKARGIAVPRGASAAEVDELISARFREDHEAIRSFRSH